MKKLKNLLQYKYFYYILFIISICYSFLFINFIKLNSYYNENNNSVKGFIISKNIDGDKLSLTIKAKEKLIVNYYFKTEKEKYNNTLKYGDYIQVYGNFTKPNKNTNFNLFNYQKYLYNNKIFYVVNAYKIKKIKNNNNLIFYIRNKIDERIKICKNTKEYINAFVIGNKKEIDYTNYNEFQELGVSHLFAISGTHVSVITMTLLFVFKRLNKYLKYILINIFLIIYIILTGFSPSVIRASILFILYSINKLFKLNIKTIYIIIFLISILLIINPYYIFNIGFVFSFIISFFLILFSEKINSKEKYIHKLVYISYLSFLISLPISIYYFNQINILSILLNIIYVPFITYIIFPLGLITFIIPIFDNYYFYIIKILELITKYFSKIKTILFFSKIPIILIIIYYIILYFFIMKKNKKSKIFLLLLIIIFYNYNRIVLPQINIMDVGQGDSLLIRIYDKNILIDTGGKVNLNQEKWKRKNTDNSIFKNILYPFFKSSGIKKLDYLIITHGDYDHMGEAINLVNNFKVEKVIFNCGEFNDLENELIKVLDKKKIPYYSCIKELNIDNNQLYFLQTKEYDNENDNSNVIYTEIDGYKFMFMGDAGVDKEKDILDKYNISDIDVLKVGHHGSKTSSSENFINEMNPKYGVISVGKNNRYGHPNKEVLNVLDNSKIYRTDIDGSTMFKIKNNKLKINTCSP